MLLKMLCVVVFALTSLATEAQEAATTVSEQDWLAAVNTVAGSGSQPNLRVRVVVYAESSGDISVLAASYKDSLCTVHLSSRGNPVDDYLQKLAATPEIARLSIAAHEYGHCVHRAAKQRGVSTMRADAWPEAFADAYAIAWMSTYYPQHLQQAIEFLGRLRKRDERGAYAFGLRVITGAGNLSLISLQRPVWEKATAILADASNK